MTEFTGRLNSIVFENNQDMFKILDVEIIGKLAGYDLSEIKVTGNFGDVQIAGTYSFTGQLVMHDRFGLQFKAESYEQVMPHEEGKLVKYLSSSKFPGIGQKAAHKIIDEIGLDVLDVLKDNPAKISTLSLTQKQKDSLLSGVNSMDSFSEIILKLAQYGIKKKVATKIYQTYQGESLEEIHQNPYKLIADIQGYSFKTADLIGKEFDIKHDDPRRIDGAIFQVIIDALSVNGDTYVELADLLTKTSKLISINDYDSIVTQINRLQKAGKIVIDEETAALTSIFQTEADIAYAIKNLIENNRLNKYKKFTEKKIQKTITEIEKELDIKYDETQKSAIQKALNNPISVLTGGPGTGKTTIINGILLALRKLDNIPASTLYSDDPPFLLAAPTGRAAKRMSEITGINAKTIHRLLGLGIGDNQAEDLNELNGDILIIDEMSMVDMFLFKKLVSAINKTKRVVFVGDKDQLPSVGPGNVFGDLIKSDVFPTTKLSQIHRQGEQSSIITLAHDVNEGKNENTLFTKTKNYSFISCTPNLVGEAVGQIVDHALKRGFEKDDIQVLGAMYNGNSGINRLNDLLQDILNKKKTKSKEIESHNETFRIGDRILQLQNNPEKDIYNGQVGKVIGIDPDNSKSALFADFDGREVSFSKKELLDITRAYAMTIHKSQGSEFPLVILNLTMQNYMMLKRNLLYTAITRAEKNLVLIGEKRAYITALNTPGNDRKTGLYEQLIKVVGKTISPDDTININSTQNIEVKGEGDSSDYLLTPEKIYSAEIDPMIGMEGITLKVN